MNLVDDIGVLKTNKLEDDIGLFENNPEFSIGRLASQTGRQAIQGVVDVSRGLTGLEETLVPKREPVELNPSGYLAQARARSDAATKDDPYRARREQAVAGLGGRIAEAIPKPLEGSPGGVGGLVEQAIGGAARFAPSMVTTAVSPPTGFAATFTQVYGGELDKYEQKGIDKERANTAALFSALGQTPIEYAGNLLQINALGKIVQGISKPAVRRLAIFGKSLFQAAAGEGAEEYLQTYPEAIADIYAENPGVAPKRLAKLTLDKITSAEFQKQAGQQALVGATAGTLLAGAGGMASIPANIVSQRSDTQQETAIEDAGVKEALKADLASNNVTHEELTALKQARPELANDIDAALAEFSQPASQAKLEDDIGLFPKQTDEEQAAILRDIEQQRSGSPELSSKPENKATPVFPFTPYAQAQDQINKEWDAYVEAERAATEARLNFARRQYGLERKTGEVPGQGVDVRQQQKELGIQPPLPQPKSAQESAKILEQAPEPPLTAREAAQPFIEQGTTEEQARRRNQAEIDKIDESALVHTMPDGSTMGGPEHVGAVPGSERSIESATTQRPKESPKAASTTENDNTKLLEQKQMLEDIISTNKANGRKPNQAHLNRLAEINVILSEGSNAEKQIKGIASDQVFGHPQATSIRPDKYSGLIPIVVSDKQSIDSRLERSQALLDELQTKIGTAQAIVNKRISATPKKVRDAKAYLKTATHTEDSTVLDLLRNETLPELNRLYSEIGKTSTPKTQKAPSSIAEQYNKENETQVSYDGEQNRDAIQKPPLHSFTFQSGPLKGRSFNLETPSVEGIQAKADELAQQTAMVKARPEAKPQKSTERAWTGNQWKPIIDKYEFTRGKNKGKYRVTFQGGKKSVVAADAIKAVAPTESIKSRLKKTLGSEEGSSQLLTDVVNIFAKKQTETPEFKKWFGDSKVVDDKGRPLVVYHGSNKVFDAFDPNMYKSENQKFYFTDSPWVASRYHGNGRTEYLNVEDEKELSQRMQNGTLVKGVPGANTYPVYLSFQNPKVIDYGGKFKERDFRRELYQAAGHDGLIIKNIRDANFYTENWPISDIYIAFEPTQIKSSIGNTGAFNPNNPSITGSSELINDIAYHGAKLIREGVESFRKFRSQMRQKFSDVWDKIKVHMRELWNVLNNERGVISIETSQKIGTKIDLPKSKEFLDAVKNTEGAEITDEGLRIKITRRQPVDQGERRSVRTGVFYQPSGSLNLYSYSGKNGYGGEHKIEGDTLLKRPMVVKGATGGKAPEVAYDNVNGKGAYQRMRSDVLDKIVMFRRGDLYEKIYNILEQYESDPYQSADDLYEFSKIAKGNGLAYAIQENIVAHALRNAGYDSIIGFSKKRSGEHFFSEVFDLRETTYPGQFKLEGELHDTFVSALKNEKGSSQLITDISEFGAEQIRKGVKSFQEFSSAMKERFSEIWDKIKDHMLSLWDVLNNQRGEIKIGGEDSRTQELINKYTRGTTKIAETKTGPVPYSETIGPVTEDDYSANRAESGKTRVNALASVRSVKSEIAMGADKFLGAISTRLGNINPKLKAKLRKLDFDINTKMADDTKSVEPMLRKAKSKMSKNDFIDWDYARKNSDKTKIYELISKYGLDKEYKQYRETLNQIRRDAVDVGLAIGEIEEYAPRVLKDSRGFLEAIVKDPEWPIYSRRLKEKASEMGISTLDMTDDEKANIISNMILFGHTGLGGLRATKSRKIEKIPAKLNRYYMHSDSALVDHIYRMRKGIEARRFFGKIPEKVSKIRTALDDNRKKLREVYAQLDNKELSQQERDAITKKKNKYIGLVNEYQAYLETYATQRDYTENVGQYVLELIESKQIDAKDERAVNDILNARFHEKGTHGLINTYKNLSYIDTMGSPISALTQIGDLAWSAYDSGIIRTVKNAAKALGKKSRITKEDVGVDRIAQEFADASTLSKAVSKVFKAVQLERMDSIGKEALLNSAYERYQSQAKNNPEKLANEIRPIFESETDSVIEDLKSGEITDNVKLLVYNRLLDFQPVGLSEMPEKYLNAGNGRIFYMLKTFTLKQFDAFRNEAYNKIRKGNRAEKIQGLKNLARLSMFFVLANAGADELKDWVLGRDTDLSDRLVDNALRLFGVSKFVTWQARTEGVGSAAAKQILPPFKFIDSLTKDVIHAGDEKGLEITKSIPVVGKLYYWHMGRGRSKRTDLWERRYKRIKSNLTDVNERYLTSGKRADFHREHRRELANYERIKLYQSNLNKLQRQINKLKKREGDHSEQIEKLTNRRIELMKRFVEKYKK